MTCPSLGSGIDLELRPLLAERIERGATDGVMALIEQQRRVEGGPQKTPIRKER